MTTTRLPGSPCPACGTWCSAATGAEGSAPRPGDISVCVYCEEVLSFDQDLRLAPCTDEKVRNSPQVQFMRLMVRAYLKREGKK